VLAGVAGVAGVAGNLQLHWARTESLTCTQPAPGCACGILNPMSQQNVEIVRRIYAAWLARDFTTVYALLDEDIELNPDPESAWVGIGEVYRGHEGMRSYLRAVYQAFDEYRPEVEQLIGAGEQVLTLAIEHGRGRGSGAEVEAHRTAHVWTLRDRKAIRLDLYLNRDDALKDVRLKESGVAAEHTASMGDPGFEPGTSSLSEKRSNRLS
jgi:ketosteroid isomerase-like protein